jgi:hypothetical protein
VNGTHSLTSAKQDVVVLVFQDDADGLAEQDLAYVVQEVRAPIGNVMLSSKVTIAVRDMAAELALYIDSRRTPAE